jgi:hypothetical protein
MNLHKDPKNPSNSLFAQPINHVKANLDSLKDKIGKYVQRAFWFLKNRA